jgi:predicted DNA-binding protein with PD1-like motif
MEQGRMGKIIVGRLMPDTSLVPGIEQMCRNADISHAIVQCAIGSLQSAYFSSAKLDPENKLGAGRGDPFRIDGPLELVSAEGIVGIDPENGEGLFTHLHGIVTDTKGRAFGGHFLAEDNCVLVTIEVVIGQIEGVRIVRRFDPESELTLFFPEKS